MSPFEVSERPYKSIRKQERCLLSLMVNCSSNWSCRRFPRWTLTLAHINKAPVRLISLSSSAERLHPTQLVNELNCINSLFVTCHLHYFLLWKKAAKMHCAFATICRLTFIPLRCKVSSVASEWNAERDQRVCTKCALCGSVLYFVSSCCMSQTVHCKPKGTRGHHCVCSRHLFSSLYMFSAWSSVFIIIVCFHGCQTLKIIISLPLWSICLWNMCGLRYWMIRRVNADPNNPMSGLSGYFFLPFWIKWHKPI